MEKNLGVFFTTIVTRINTTTQSISSNPNKGIQTTLYLCYLLSLQIPTLVCIYLFTEPLFLALNYICCSLLSPLCLFRSSGFSPTFLAPETLIQYEALTVRAILTLNSHECNC